MHDLVHIYFSTGNFKCKQFISALCQQKHPECAPGTACQELLIYLWLMLTEEFPCRLGFHQYQKLLGSNVINTICETLAPSNWPQDSPGWNNFECLHLIIVPESLKKLPEVVLSLDTVIPPWNATTRLDAITSLLCQGPLDYPVESRPVKREDWWANAILWLHQGWRRPFDKVPHVGQFGF